MDHAKIEKRNVEDMMGLTAMQEGMLFHYLADPDSQQYFEQFRFKLPGKIDIRRFEEAWDAVTQTNEMLRSVIRWEQLEEPVQIVLKDKKIPIRVLDFTGEKKEAIPAALDKIAIDDKNESIDLTCNPLRITLALTGNDENEMIFTFHHILYDGWSNGIVLKEFLGVYNNCLAEGEASGITGKTKYKEFIKWYQADRLQNKNKHKEFWKGCLDDFDTRTLLPYDKNKTEDIRSVQTVREDVVSALKKQVDEFSQANNTTLAAILYTAWGILLQKYNNADDIIFGTTVSGRIPDIKGIDSMVGLFINTIPLRLKTTGERTILEVLAEVGAHLNERSSHEHSPLTDIRLWSGMGKESHLFDSIFVIDNYPLPVSNQASANLAIKSYETFEMAEFDLTLQVMLPYTDTGSMNGMTVDFHYNADLFEAGTIRRLAGHYLNILDGITVAPTGKIAEIQALSEVEIRQILCEFNDPGIEFELNKTIHGEIEEQAVRVPGNRAVQFGDCWLSYKELNESANRLAHLLKTYGVSGDSRAAMLMPRSIEMIVGLLGILKAGAACIPLDISYPVERNGFILQDSEVGFLLKHSSVESIEAPGVREILCDRENLDAYAAENLNIAVNPKDLAYIIYTSGSTGKPKGALLHHSNIVNHTYTKIGVLGISEADTVASNFSINVIAAVWQMLAPLFMGARLVVYTDEVEWDPYLQFQVVEADGVTIIELIPPVLKTYLFLLDEGKEKIGLENLRKIALTSEETKPFVVNKFYEKYPRIDLVDCYGQTECSDDILHYTIPVDTNTQKVPIGTPSLNTNVFILNHHYQLQPVGVVGEICTIGAGVCYGYWKRPEMTAEKFIELEDRNKSFGKSKNPFSKGFLAAGGKLYKTGDFGKWMPDGRVEYLGRIDHQVKIRGNRVELREIENHVLRYPAIKEVAVVAREDREGEKNLYAFFVSGEDVTVSEIRRFLLKTLPDYMVPAHFIPLESLPLTPNGKIDRKVLVCMEIEGSAGAGVSYLLPRNEYEIKIQEIWKQLLEKENIGINDNFFDLGGHSLLLIKLKSKLEKTFGLKQAISVVELFRYPTIERQAGFIEENVTGKADVEVEKEEAREAQESRSGSLDIAVIGIAMRAPGAAGIDEFWRNIINGVESITFFQEDELESSEAYRVIKGSSRLIAAGGVMGEIDLFDADFFGYHPREAELMDPQQRIFLQYAWRALEDAGYVGETYPGSIGVYAGVGWNTYLLNNVLKNPGVIKTQGEFQTMIGNDKDFLTTRVSYKLNLRGPSVAIQSACSTSLTAIHLARQALLNYDCDMALSGGIAVKIPEKTGYFYTEGGHLSPDGHCRPFDAGAKGTVFGNGVGIVVLKRLAEAIKDNDHIYAVIKGSAINNDGSLKVGFHSPGETGQTNVVLKALQESGVPPHTIGYVETHGTGTALGDPVEISALARAYGSAGSGKQYCAVGSVKANIGHLDVAAGVIGLIKAVLCLKHKQIPPSINVTDPNPLIGFAGSPFYVNLELRDWPGAETGTPRRAAASSLGIGGTNAHVILEEYLGVRGQGSGIKEYELILLSAKTKIALKQQARNLTDYFKKDNVKFSMNMADAAYTLQVGRARFQYRQMFVCSNADEAIEALSYSEKREIFFSETSSRPIIFMFPGQGSQYVDMGLHLYQNEAVFRREMDHCFEILLPILKYDLKEILYPGEVAAKNAKSCEDKKEIEQTEIVQPLLFIFEYSLARLLMKWGVKPHAMIGHSIGEYTAACLSGVLTLEDALKLVAARGKLMQKMPPGAMLSIPLSEQDLLTLLKENDRGGAGLSLAAVNSSGLCVVSGTNDAVDRFEKQLKMKGYDCTLLHTSHAFHSPMMDPILKEFEETANQGRLSPPRIPYISNLTGDWITEVEATSPAYWANHLRRTVRFADGIKKLLEITAPIFIEVGPGRTASTFVKQHLEIDKKDGPAIIDLVRHPKKQISDSYYLLNSIGQLWLYGLEIDWKEFHAGDERHRVPLPTYPFAKNRYWLQPGKDNTADRESAEVKKKIEDWFYIPSWKQTTPSFLNPEEIEKNLEQPKCWLLFLAGPGARFLAQEQLIHKLKEKGQTVVTVTADERFARTGEGAYEINPCNMDDYDTLLEDMGNHDKTIDRIVHLWTLTGSKSDMFDKANRFDSFLERSVYSILYLVKALGKHSLFNPMEFWIISDQMHNIESGDTCSPVKGTIPGPCKVISQEYPNIICRILEIDIAPENGGQENTIQNLISELNVSPPDRVIAYRGNNRWVQSYEPVKLGNRPGVPAKLRPNGVYLITGGLGRIGLTFAHYFAQAVQAKLILADLQYLPPGLAGDPRIKNLEEVGAEVQVIVADVSDKEQMAHARRLAEERFGEIHGVIHTAGIMADEHFKPIAQLDRETCEMHFGPKIHGTRVLAEVFNDKPLDFCILTSSLSTVLGGIGLYAYSAANNFMDTFAREQNRVYGKNWISINWDEWQRDRAPSCVRNTVTITGEEGKEALKRILAMNSPGTPQVVISCSNLDQRLRQWVLPISAPVSETGALDEPPDANSAAHQRPQLQNIYEGPHTDAEKIAAEIWEQLLGIAPVGVQDDFFALGGHSLLATKLIARMREVFRIDLPLSILFDKPTIREVVSYVVDTWGDAETVEEIARTYREVFSN